MYRRVSGRTNFHRPKTCHYCMLIVSVRGDTVVGISITIFLVSFSAGALLATLITYCMLLCERDRGEQQWTGIPFSLREPSGNSRNEGASLL